MMSVSLYRITVIIKIKMSHKHRMTFLFNQT